MIDLVNPSRHQRIASTLTARDGSFHFSGVEAGSYELQVLAGTELLKREFVVAHTGTSDLMIRIDLPSARTSPAPRGPLSLFRLQHKVPGKAQKLFRTGSLEALERAVEIDPDYMEAHNNLGCRYLQSGENELALEHLQKAVKLDPSAAQTQTNLAIAFIQLNRLGEAETTARRAIELGDTSAKAEYVVAMILIRQGRGREEALRYLRSASEGFPAAKAVLEKLR